MRKAQQVRHLGGLRLQRVGGETALFQRIRQELYRQEVTMGDTPKAFVSYSRADTDFVLRLCQDLRAAGASIWLDQLDIHPGEEWDEAIERGLSECGRMLIVLSPHSVASENVLDEIGSALSRKKPIIRES